MVRVEEKVEPEVYTYIDPQDNHITIEIVLPDVVKESIRLMINARCLRVYAASGTVNYEKYLSFKEPVIPERTKARYEHDILRIIIPLRA
jgi:HSP20 family molecular chaperone IbpA